MVTIQPNFFKIKHEKIMEHLASNLLFPSLVPDDPLVSDNNGCILWQIADILLYFLEFGALDAKDQLNSINATSQKIRDLISNVVSLIQNGKYNEIWICSYQICRFAINYLNYIESAYSVLDDQGKNAGVMGNIENQRKAFQQTEHHLNKLTFYLALPRPAEKVYSCKLIEDQF
jgi:hypothetical protein